MKLIITTPEGTKFESDHVEIVTLPTVAGQIGIKDDHVPLVSVIAAGEIEVELQTSRNKPPKKEFFAVSGGILNVESDSVVRVLADTAEGQHDIDAERARNARERAEKFLAETDTADLANVRLIQAQIEKHLARERIGNRYRKLKST